jgi:hypothetical protein
VDASGLISGIHPAQRTPAAASGLRLGRQRLQPGDHALWLPFDANRQLGAGRGAGVQNSGARMG